MKFVFEELSVPLAIPLSIWKKILKNLESLSIFVLQISLIRNHSSKLVLSL